MDPRARRLLSVAFSACLAGCSAQAMRGSQSSVPVPIVVELFTSEGCSSCPPADALLQKMADTQPAAGAEIIALGEHVDYWDRQGWKDRFSSALFTRRQQLYGARFNTESIYTPQMVVDGRSELVGSDGEAARKAIQHASGQPHGRMDLQADRVGAAVRVAAAASQLPPLSAGDRAEIVVAITEDRLQSDVTRGENRGRVLKHGPVVRQLHVVGEPIAAEGGTTTADLILDADWQSERLKIVAFVQERRSRAILASAAIPVPRR